METREERLERRRRERAEQVAYKLEQEIAVWDPAGIPNVTADPFKTLFVARIVSTASFVMRDCVRKTQRSQSYRIYDVLVYVIDNVNICTCHVLCSFLQNYDTSESKLRREFEIYGTVKKASCLLREFNNR